ncbi:hypothetical protein CAL13_00710 [Bordetella genomosp. 9]|uniref:Uncharacterized protein n=1 Tax=Bordetella genomosp. 9 TaxID=1416803 RepID=A0A1W6YV98_9BORD|nr:hypothetical protein CAL13_00710 [Bordetella genomosp. 9]
MSVISPSPVAKDSLSPPPADARSFEAPPPPFTVDAASAKYPNAANNDDADLFAARIADIGNSRTGDTRAADEGGGRDANGSVDHEATARRIVAAFVAHARAARNLPAEADASHVIAAYFAPHAKGDADTAGRWLEDDTSLLLGLAKASGLFEGDVDAASLEAGHRRLLANALVLSLTRAIDWKAALGADGADGATVFYDGITLRNATRLSLRDAAAAMDARIGQALDAAAGTKGLGAMIPQLRTALIGDPTLSFHPLPQTVRYGSRDWMNLWAGIEACKDAGLNPAALSFDEVTAFGQAMSMAPTSSAERGHELAQTAVLLMAHAAGKADLAQLREDNQAEITEKIQAFAAQEFKSEIALGEVTARLLALGDPPTAQGIAEEALKELGLDPRAIVIEEPVSSKGKRLSFKLHDFYVRFNDLSEIEPGPYNNDLIAEIGDNAPRYKDVYNRKFDAYISNYIDAHKGLVRVMTDIARQDGFREGDPDASIRIDRIAITSPSDIQAYGFFIRYSDGKSLYRYFFSPSGIVEKFQTRWAARTGLEATAISPWPRKT